MPIEQPGLPSFGLLFSGFQLVRNTAGTSHLLLLLAEPQGRSFHAICVTNAAPNNVQRLALSTDAAALEEAAEAEVPTRVL